LEAAIKKKIEAKGKPLKDWEISIYRGILTGLNEAFIINKEIKDRLISASPKSAEIIRPILRGKNIHRYSSDLPEEWVIFIPWHFPLHEDPLIKGASEIAELAFKKEYKAVYDYLLENKEALKNRNKAETGIRYEWYALQRFGANYWKDFEKKKIVWGNLALKGSFSFVAEGIYINAPSAFIATENLYLLAILNSRISDFYIKQLGVTRNGGYFEYKPMFVEQLPVPQVAIDIEEKFSILVKQRLSSDEIESIEIDKKIDEMAFKLYGLTPDEIKAVLNS
jgi:adenine-specific DNA-methyltransferase